ncbi:MAG: hypothetical protein WC570_02610 [Patescibacteria group bacterium]
MRNIESKVDVLKEKEKQVLIMSVNSLSCSATDPKRPLEIVYPPLATQKLIERTKEYIEKVFKPARFDNTGVSLHGGFVTQIEKFKGKNINITSGDLPDVNWFEKESAIQLMNDLVKDVFYRLPKKGIDKLLGKKNGDKLMTPQHVGWRVNSAPSQASLRTKMHQLQNICDPDCHGKIYIRVNAQEIKKTNWKNILGNLRKNSVLAIEYNPDYYTMQEFLNTISQMRQERGDHISFSFDTAHVRRGYDDQKNGPPEQELDRICHDNDKQKMMSIVELNQIKAGEKYTHSPLADGLVDLVKIMGIFGRLIREKTDRVYQPQVVVETHPADFDNMIANGKTYFSQMYRAYMDLRK